MSKFVEPVSVEEAEERSARVKLRIVELQTALSQKNRVDGNGQRLGDHEYHNWRGQTLSALRGALGENAKLKLWLKATRRRTDDLRAGVAEGGTLLERAFALLSRLRAEGVDFDLDELDLLIAIECELQKKSKAEAAT